MRKLIGGLCVVTLAAGICVGQEAAKKPSEKKAASSGNAKTEKAASGPSFAGTWKLNTAKSQYADKSMAPKSGTLHITKLDDKTIAWTYTATDAAGKTMKASYSAPNDGKAHPVTGDPGIQSAIFKISGNVVDITWLDAKGNNVGSEHSTLAADGKSFSAEEKFKDKDGKDVSMTEVYERASGGTTNAAKKTAEKPAEKK